jgi:uncharacterized protein YndB with AHSA1/START domain
MRPTGLQITTPTDNTIILSPTCDAPRRLVWDAMLVPEKMRRWMCAPPGWDMSVCECETRVGGGLRLVWKSAESDPAMMLYGVFTEVALHERIVHTETMVTGSGEPAGTLVETHEFKEERGATRLRITQVYPSKAARDGAIASGMDQGMEAGYQQLDAMLARPA